MNANNRCRLRLLSEHNRFYASGTTLRSLTKRGLVIPTGHTDDANRVEWTITDDGRRALSATESLLTAECDPSVRFREQKG